MHLSRSLLATAASAVLALLLAAPAFATFPGDNGRIAYTNTTDGHAAQFVETVNPDGSDVDTLTGTSAQGPAWSPDGSRIVYSHNNEIWIMNADGSGKEQLTDTPALSERRPSFSPDGSQIVYSDETNYELHVMKADGSEQETINPDGFTDAYGPEWSPDGSRIAFAGQDGTTSGDALWTVRPDGTDAVLISDFAGQDLGPSWSPDGERIVFYADPTDTSAWTLYVVDAEGDEEPDAISDPTDPLIGPTWSPEGDLIAAVRRANGDIVTMEPDGDNLTTVLPDGENRGGLRWQTLPDAPAATTGDATDITQTGVTLNGVVNPATRAFDATYRFEYGPTAEYGASTDEVTLEGTTEDQAVSAVVDGLQPGTEYHYRLVATNESGTTTGEDRTFTTVAPPPPPPQQPPAQCPEGTVGVAPQCVAIIAKEPAKLSLLRATMDEDDRTISIFAPITKRASGRVRIRLHAAGRFTRFTAPIDTTNGWIRVVRKIPRAQAELGTGILTIRYAGDEDTRPQRVRSRAARNPAQLRLERPTIIGNRFQASGTVNPLARGKVRMIIQYQVGNETIQVRRKTRIRIGGRWGENTRLSQRVLDQLGRRVGTVHSYTQFTGYMERRIRGEQRSYQIAGPR